MLLDPIVLSATRVLQRLTERLSGSINTSTIANFVKYAQELAPLDHYKFFPEKARLLIPHGKLADGVEASKLFLKAAIIHGTLETLTSERFAQLPSRVRSQQIRQLERIVADGNDTPEWLRVDHDIFYKEFGIATLRLYVAGSQLVDYRCGIPRSVLFKGGLRALLKNAAAISRLGGFRMYFQIHTHKLMLDSFNEEGWNECYLCCAELYRIHPEVLGMYGSSWFYDPALDTISPRLSYLRKIPASGGAELFFMEEGGSSTNNSLATSATRRKLYDEGKYSPKGYMMAWGKAKQMAWAEDHLKNLLSAEGPRFHDPSCV
jgi:hypothetical protein